MALIAQVGNGLDAIHAAGLVHRDVKPANVLLSGEEGAEHAYITDFGVARNVATQSGLTQTGRFVGTLDYVAPEQISGGAVDARVDVYALGCLLFKLLTGEVPYPARRRGGAPLRPPQRPAAGALAVRAGGARWRSTTSSSGRCRSSPRIATPRPATSAGRRSRRSAAAPSRSRSARWRPAPPRPAPRRRSQPQPPIRKLDRRRARRARPPGRRRLPRWRTAVCLPRCAIVVGRGRARRLGWRGRRRRRHHGAQKRSDGARGRPRSPEPKSLTKAELIAKGDAICTDEPGQVQSYSGRRPFPNGEFEADAVYSRLLVGISSTAVRRFNELTPPPPLAEAATSAIVKSQEEVKDWDRDALEAAEAGDKAAYLAARETRNQTELERQAAGRSRRASPSAAAVNSNPS